MYSPLDHAVSPERIVDPVNEPLTLEQAKLQCNVEVSETFYDPWFGSDGGNGERGAITAARELVEKDAQVCLMPQTWKLCLTDWNRWGGDYVYRAAYDNFRPLRVSSLIDLTVHPVQTISSIKYYPSGSDVLTDFDLTHVAVRRRKYRSFAELVKSDTVLPSLNSIYTYPIEITFTAGYSQSTDVGAQRRAVPMVAIQAMKLLIAHWFRNREAVVFGSANEADLTYRSCCKSLNPSRYA